jgi:ribokinase
VEILLRAADLVTPNRIEALMLAGTGGPGGSDPAACARRLLGLGPRAVLITLGAEGCLVAEADTVRTVPAPVVEAVDTVGAGDAFNGALAVAIGEGRPLIEAARWAVAAGALATTRPGAQSALPRRGEIEDLCHDRSR